MSKNTRLEDINRPTDVPSEVETEVRLNTPMVWQHKHPGNGGYLLKVWEYSNGDWFVTKEMYLPSPIRYYV